MTWKCNFSKVRGSILLFQYHYRSVLKLTVGGVRGGNNAHLAPEVLNARPGRGQYISYSKQPVWAAGVLAYELCGHPSPFDGNTDQTAYTESALPYLKTTAGRNDARATLPAGITKLVHSMLAYDPDKRPSLRDVLRRVSDLAWTSKTKTDHNKYTSLIRVWSLIEICIIIKNLEFSDPHWFHLRLLNMAENDVPSPSGEACEVSPTVATKPLQRTIR